MNKELRRLLELAGVKQQSTLIDNLYESQKNPDLPKVDDERYPPIKGMEGPFRMKSGRVVYYDPKEGQYYDRRVDHYLSDEEAYALHEDKEYEPEIVLFALKEGEEKPLRFFVETITEIKPLATSLMKSGYTNFEYSVDEVDFRKPVFPVYEEEGDAAAVDKEHTAMKTDPKVYSEWEKSIKDTYGDVEIEKGKDGMAKAFRKDEKTGKRIGVGEWDGKKGSFVKESDDNKLTDAQKEKLDKLKKQHEGGSMQKNMRDQYGKEEGDRVFYATLTKMAKGEKVNESEENDIIEEHHFKKGDLVVSTLPDGRKIKGTVKFSNYDPKGPTTQYYEYFLDVDGKDVKVPAKKTRKVEREPALAEQAEAVDVTAFDNTNLPSNAVDDMAQKAERTGFADRLETKMKHPKEVMKGIDTRIKELEQSIKRFDQNQFYGYNSPKHNAIDSLKEIKRFLDMGDYDGFMQAQIYFGTLMSAIWDLLPASLVNYLHKGDDSFEEN